MSLPSPEIHYRSLTVQGVDLFYREAGSREAPTVILLHGFPTSSHMYRDLIPVLARDYHVIAPDYPGFGYSAAPAVDQFEYTFDNLANLLESFCESLSLVSFTLYIQDYGAPVGFRLATKHPERINALVIQNGNAYDEGLSAEFQRMAPFWANQNSESEKLARALLTPEGTKFQYTHGVKDPSRLNPDAWTFAQAGLDRPGNAEIQLALLYDYQNNFSQYSKWHAYLRKHQPPTLIVWGKNDPIFTEAGARGYLRDLPGAELHLLDTGHFALEEAAPQIASLMLTFLGKHLQLREFTRV